MAVIAPVSASSILSIHPSDDEYQEIPCTPTNYGEKYQTETMAKIPDDVTLTLH